MAALRSRLGRANAKGVWGWALDMDDPERKLTVEIVIDDRVVGRVVADDPRPNLKILAPEHRDCGFEFLFPNGLSALSRHVIHARSAAGGEALELSPVVVEPAARFDPALEQTLDSALKVAVDAATSESELDTSLDFVAGQIDRLLEARRRMTAEGAPGPATSLPPELAQLGERWAGWSNGDAASHPEPPGGDPDLRRALVIGDAARVMDDAARLPLAHVASLRRLGLAVEFVASEFRPETTAQIAAFEAIGAVYRRPPLTLTVEELLRRNRGLYETVVLSGIGNAERYLALARHYCPRARVIYDVGSLFFLRMLRRAALQAWQVGIEKGNALRLREMMAAWGSHAVITCSEFEAALIRRGVPQAQVHVVPWPAATRPRRAGFGDRLGIGFIGDYTSHADLDAAAWLIEVLMPAVWAIDPTVTCLVAGCHMPEALRTLVRDRVEILEQMPGQPDGGEAVFERVRLTVAVQRTASGLLDGVVASLAAGVPCIGTPVALEALPLPESLRGSVADTVPALAALACRLHADAAANGAAAEAGLRFVAESLSEDAIDRRMLAAIGADARAPATEAG